MPNTGLDPKAYKRLRERLYYRRIYKAKKIAQAQSWRSKNPDKCVQYALTQRNGVTE